MAIAAVGIVSVILYWYALHANVAAPVSAASARRATIVERRYAAREREAA